MDMKYWIIKLQEIKSEMLRTLEMAKLTLWDILKALRTPVEDAHGILSMVKKQQQL